MRKIALEDAPAEWFKVFALIGMPVDGGEFEVSGELGESLPNVSLESDMFSKKSFDVLPRATCYICYKGACLVCTNVQM